MDRHSDVVSLLFCTENKLFATFQQNFRLNFRCFTFHCSSPESRLQLLQTNAHFSKSLLFSLLLDPVQQPIVDFLQQPEQPVKTGFILEGGVSSVCVCVCVCALAPPWWFSFSRKIPSWMVCGHVFHHSASVQCCHLQAGGGSAGCFYSRVEKHKGATAETDSRSVIRSFSVNKLLKSTSVMRSVMTEEKRNWNKHSLFLFFSSSSGFGVSGAFGQRRRAVAAASERLLQVSGLWNI